MSLPLLPRDLQCYILSFADARTLLCGVGAASRALHALIASPPAWSLSRAADLTFAATHALLNDATVCRLASAWQSLSILDLSRTKHATPAAFQAVWRHCYALTELRVRACVHFGDACVPAAPPKCASNMRILDVSENQLLSASGLRRLCTHLPHLRTLNLSALRAVTTDVLAALPAVCARLEKLVLRRCPLVTNRGIGALATLAHLQRLDVSEVDGVGAVGLSALLRLDHDVEQTSTASSTFLTPMRSAPLPASSSSLTSSSSSLSPALVSGTSSSSSTASLFTTPTLPSAMHSERALQQRRDRRRTEWQRCVSACVSHYADARERLELAPSATDALTASPLIAHFESEAARGNGVAASPLLAFKASSCASMDDESVHALAMAAARASARADGSAGWKKLVLKGGAFGGNSVFALLSVSQHSLIELNLDGCANIDDIVCAGVALFGRSIEILILSRCAGVREHGFMLLQHMPSLTSVNLSDNRHLTAAAVTALASSPSCAHLKSLQIARCTSVSSASLASLLAATPMLERLNVDGCTQLGDEAMLTVQRCPHLRELHACGLRLMTDAVAHALATCSGVRSACALQAVDLSDCTQLTSAGLAALLRATPRLLQLDLTLCASAVDDSVLLALASGSPALTSLRIGGCARVSDTGVAAVAAHCRALAFLDLHGCRLLTSASLVALDAGCAQLKRTTCNLSGCIALHDDARRQWLSRGQWSPDTSKASSKAAKAPADGMPTMLPELPPPPSSLPLSSSFSSSASSVAADTRSEHRAAKRARITPLGM